MAGLFFEARRGQGCIASNLTSPERLTIFCSFGLSLGKSFGWKKRIQERDLSVVREVASRTLNSEISRREQGLQIVQMAVLRLAKAIAEGEIKMSLSDLDKLIRLEAFLSNEPDSRQEVVFAELKGKSDEELREMVREEMRLLEEVNANSG